MSLSPTALLIPAFVGMLTVAQAQLEPAVGFSSKTLVSFPGSSIPGGLCVLPNGSIACYDGTKVSMIDSVTGRSTTLFVPPSFVFGSFLIVEPSGQSLVFGESSAGTITRIPLSGATPTLVATVPLAYDAAFSPSGDLYVSHGNSSWTATEIVKIDLGSGGLDSIANVPGPSGPLCFDGFGNLLYGENSSAFPAPPGSGTIWFWQAAQVESAAGPTALSTADATAFATQLDATSDMIFDAEGDLVVTDSAKGKVFALSATGSYRHAIAESANGAVTFLAFLDDSSANIARFDPFQPPAGGELLVVDSDYATYTAITSIRPRRPILATTPDSPIPVGTFTLSMTDAAPHAWLHVFVAAAEMPEIPVFLLGTPMFFGLAPGAIVALPPLQLDGSGSISLPASNPGLGIPVHLQAALVDLTVGPYGTTPVTTLVLQ